MLTSLVKVEYVIEFTERELEVLSDKYGSDRNVVLSLEAEIEQALGRTKSITQVVLYAKKIYLTVVTGDSIQISKEVLAAVRTKLDTILGN